jgi:hypothetical protein
MGRVCAWCGAVIKACGATNAPVSHTICGGCLEELRLALARTGLRLARPGAGAHRQ